MAKKKSNNKSLAIRELLAKTPDIGAKEAVATLANKGIEVKAGLFYIVKGKVQAKKSRKAKVIRAARSAAESTSHFDAVGLIRDVKALAGRAGGYRNLIGLIEALSE